MARGDTKIKDRSGDRKYFIQAPMLVWALTQDPYELALWLVIKMVAWEDDECTLSTDDLAALAMMSTGKVSQCRARLMELGLIEGELRKDPDYPQSVWHLSIPDVWRVNLEWAEKHTTMRSKVDHKTLIRAEKYARRAAVKSLHHAKAEVKEPSPHEGGTPPHEGGTPPHEGGTPPHEGGTPPHETTNIYIDNIDSLERGREQNTHARAIAHADSESFDGPSPNGSSKAKTPPRLSRRKMQQRKGPHFDPGKVVEEFVPGGEGMTPVEVYFERFSPYEYKLSAPLQDDLVKAVTDLDRWRAVVVAWHQADHKPGNTGGMLDWYRDPSRLPANRHRPNQNGVTPTATKALSETTFKDWLLRTYYADSLPAVIRKTKKQESELRDEYKQWRTTHGLPPG